MKKILLLSLILTSISAAASAQRGPGYRSHRQRAVAGFNSGQITRPERFELRKDLVRQRVIQHHARRDGVITPMEKRRIHKAKCNTRRDVIRFRHNGRNRVI